MENGGDDNNRNHVKEGDHQIYLVFFLKDTAPPEIYPLPLHDALPICRTRLRRTLRRSEARQRGPAKTVHVPFWSASDAAPMPRTNRPPSYRLHKARNLAVVTIDGKRSEEHTSELQSQSNLVCRLLLEK